MRTGVLFLIVAVGGVFLGVGVVTALAILKRLSRTEALRVLLSILLSTGFLLVGVVGMLFLSSLKQAPPKAPPREVGIFVKAVAVHPEDVPVQLTGFGTVRARDITKISPQVSGNVVKIHPDLDTGEIIPGGEVLFCIDPRTYQARLDNVKANVARLTHQLRQLDVQHEIDVARLQTLKRTVKLAEKEFFRVRDLFTKDKVGSQAGVERAEQAYNAARDRYDQLRQAVDLYAARRQELESALKAARAQQEQAALDLERTRVTAPFDGRVRWHSVELGQFVAPGVPVLELADDSVREISVPLNSNAARKWLAFKHGPPTDDKAWFGPLEPVSCTIRWAENPDKQWKGVLDRVEQYDPKMRQLTVVVRVSNQQARGGNTGGLPLVEGMFCSVSVPGKTLHHAFRLPRSAVSFQNTVYVARPGDAPEIRIPLTARQVARWPQFEGEWTADGFPDWRPVGCSIEVEGRSEPLPGWVESVEDVNVGRRTLTLVVHVNGHKIAHVQDILRKGTVCRVVFPGRIFSSRKPVTYEGTVSVYRQYRLETRPVVMAYEEDNWAFVTSGIKPGELVIITRLITPFENALLNVEQVDPGQAGALAAAAEDKGL